NLSPNLAPPPPPPPPTIFYEPGFPSSYRSLTFTVEEVRSELGRMCPGKAVGPDGVCLRVLK
ncbi:hypothetical protein M9458_052748, partial [Cirrhinus mrigala]